MSYPPQCEFDGCTAFVGSMCDDHLAGEAGEAFDECRGQLDEALAVLARIGKEAGICDIATPDQIERAVIKEFRKLRDSPQAREGPGGDQRYAGTPPNVVTDAKPKFAVGDRVNYHPLIDGSVVGTYTIRTVQAAGIPSHRKPVYWFIGKAGCVSEEALSSAMPPTDLDRFEEIYNAVSNGALEHEPEAEADMMFLCQRVRDLKGELEQLKSRLAIVEEKSPLGEPRKHSSMSTKPIRPEDVVSHKQGDIPSVVIDVFNELIAENYQNGRAQVFQAHAVQRLVAAGLDRDELFRRGWLDVEGIYRAADWFVDFDKPGYNETYDAFWVFRKRPG